MKSFVIGIALSFTVLAVVGYLNGQSLGPRSFLAKDKIPTEIPALWAQWKSQHNRNYSSASQEQYRLQVFHSNYKQVQSTNAKTSTYKLALNKFSDLTAAEFQNRLSKSDPGSQPRNDKFLDTTGLPDSIDWRTKGTAVTGIKEQGPCGSSWAFSAVGAIEGLAYISSKQPDVSVQQLLDCTKGMPYDNKGCLGGFMTTAFEYLAKNGWESEQDYKYTAKYGACAYDKSLTVASNKSYHTVPVDNDQQLMAAVVQGPVSVAIDMSMLYQYKGGVFTGCQPNSQTSHGSLVIGYGSDNGQDFWLLKETWGLEFAEKGFMRIARGNHNNDCAITKSASYPTM